MALKGAVKMSAQPHFEEEPKVRGLLAEVPLPPGVKLQRIDTGEDNTGDPVMWFVFGVSKSLPLTRKRVKALAQLSTELNRKMLSAGMPKWPLTRFVDVK